MSTLLSLVQTYKITDLSKGPGVIPVKIQDSFRITKYYTYIHSINIQSIKLELIRLSKLINLIDSYDSKYQITSLNQHLSYSQNKLEHLLLNRPNVLKRTKRGLINGLGSAISWLTGNMDANDKKHYDDIINKLESNNYHIEHNVENQISINKKLIEEFKRH